MKNRFIIILMLVLAISLSGCKVYNAVRANSQFELKKTDVDPTSFSSKFTIWNFDEIVKTFIPESPKLENFKENFEKYCALKIEKCPKTVKDSFSVSLSCHNLPIDLANKIKPKTE